MFVKDMMSNERYMTLFDNWLIAHHFEPSMVDCRKKASDTLKWTYAKLAVAGHIWRFIDRYGYGEKPTEMDTVEYWLAHVDFENLKTTKFQPIFR